MPAAAGGNPVPPPPPPYAQPSQVKHPVRRFLLYFLLALFGLLTGLILYVLILLGQPLRTQIGFADDDDFEPISLDDVVLEEEVELLPWDQGGRTRVNVHPDFPIRRVKQKDPKIENVLVFGVDARSTEEVVSRADSIIVVTIDERHGAIKLTSIMRDTQVTIEGRSQKDKINASYAYGGVGLLINTVNETFDLDIQRFAMFDFWSAASLIDSIGGVEVTIQEAELQYLNRNLNEQLRLLGQPDKSSPVEEPGLQNLDGSQAIAWARIRKLDSDIVRSSRQRTVMMAMIEQFSDASATSMLSLMNSGLSVFETNMRNTDMIRVGLNALPEAKQIYEYRVPEDGFYTVQPNPWMMVVDWDKQNPALHDFIWGDLPQQ